MTAVYTISAKELDDYINHTNVLIIDLRSREEYIKIFYDDYSFNLTRRSLNTDGVSIRIKKNKVP